MIKMYTNQISDRAASHRPSEGAYVRLLLH